MSHGRVYITVFIHIPCGSSLLLPKMLDCVVKSLMRVVRGSLRLQGSWSFAIMTKSYQNVLLLLFMSPYLINGAPTTAPISLPSNDALSTYYCNDSPAWSGPSFFPKDCATAVSRFYVQEILTHEDEVFEFLAIGARPQLRYPSQHTPRKYTYGAPTRTDLLNICLRSGDIRLLQWIVRDS